MWSSVESLLCRGTDVIAASVMLANASATASSAEAKSAIAQEIAFSLDKLHN